MTNTNEVLQLFGIKEDTEGTYETDATLLAVAASEATNGILAYEATLEPEYEEHERRPSSSSGAAKPSQIGRRTHKIGFKMDLKANGSSGSPLAPVEPTFAQYLKACGMRMIRVRQVALTGSVTGTFQHLEAFTAAGGGSGYIVGGPTGSPTKLLYLIDGSEPLTSEVITGTTSGATVTTHGTPDLADHGFLYLPATKIVNTIARGAVTGTLQIGEVVVGGTSTATAFVLGPLGDQSAAGTLYLAPIQGTLQNAETLTGQESAATLSTTGAPVTQSNWTASFATIFDGYKLTTRGARGTWKAEFAAGEPMMIGFEFQGVEVAKGDQPIVSDYHPAYVAPPLFESAGVTIDTKTLLMRKFAADHGGTVVWRDSPSLANGILSARVASRRVVGSFDPEWTDATTDDVLTKWSAGTLAAVKIRIGVTEAAIGGSGHTVGTGIWIDVPTAQYTKVAAAEREGTRTSDRTYLATEEKQIAYLVGDDELRIWIL